MRENPLVLFICSLLFIGAYWTACESTTMMSAKVYVQQHNLEKAEELALIAVASESANPLPSYWLAVNVYAKQERWEEMKAMFDKSLSISPKFAADIKNQSEFHWVDQFNAGANLFNVVLNGESSNGDFALSAAIKSFENAILIIPERAQAYSGIASIYLYKKDVDSAKMYLVKSVELDATDFKALVNLGIIYSKEKDYDKADSYLSEVLERDPGNLIALQQLAENSDSQGKSDEAEATYHKALEADPENANLMYNLGVIYLRADNYEKAEEMFVGSLKLNPDDCDAISNVAVVYSNLEGRLPEAENYLLKAVDCAPTENVYWRQLVGIYMKMGKPNKAQEALIQAKRLGYSPSFVSNTDERNNSETKPSNNNRAEIKERFDNKAPTIIIIEPQVSRGIKIKQTEKKLLVRGKAYDESGIYEVTINGQEADIGQNNEFWAEIKLGVGENKIHIIAIDSKDNISEQTFTVTRTPSSKKPPVTESKEIVTGQYIALIIGINKYSGDWAPLQNAVHDARAVENILQSKYGFNTIISLYDEEATRTGILNKLMWLVENVSANDNVLIYYSGHGEFEKTLERGYWVPADARGASIVNYIPNSEIKVILKAVPSKHTLLISDACFAGDIFRGKDVSIPFDNSERYYRESYKRVSRQAITSGGNEPVMDGGKDGHSVFTYYLLKALKQNNSLYLDAAQLFNDLKIPVSRNSNQTPVLKHLKNTGDEGGQFIFVRSK